MASLHTKVKKYLEANSKTENELYNGNIVLADDGDGVVHIRTFNVDGVTKPTDAQLDALETQATIYENNLKQDAKRKSEYGSWEFQLDEIYHNGIDAWKTRIQSIKDKYPKQ